MVSSGIELHLNEFVGANEDGILLPLGSEFRFIKFLKDFQDSEMPTQMMIRLKRTQAHKKEWLKSREEADERFDKKWYKE